MPQFVIQHHRSRTDHFDFRLERDGALKSWVLPKGPPLETGIRRLAIAVDDHALTFGEFEGTIPDGQYGAGTISIWDRGTYETDEWSDNQIKVHLHGNRISGTYELLRFVRKGPREWLLTKVG